MPSFDCAPEYIQKNHYYTQTGKVAYANATSFAMVALTVCFS